MNPLSFLGLNDQEAAEALEYFREYLPGQRPVRRGGEDMSDLNELLRQAREARLVNTLHHLRPPDFPLPASSCDNRPS